MIQTDQNSRFILDLFDLKPRKGDLKKVEIIQATISCLAVEGLEKTTFDAIAKRINTRRAHVAYHFTDKKDIFKACVTYIIANYQRISMENLEEEKDGELILSYIEAVFIWAKKYPDQVSVMLLLYYFCSFDSEFKDIHHRIRGEGHIRMMKILKKSYAHRLGENDIMTLSKSLQNLTSASIIDAYTTKNKSLGQAKNEVLEIAKVLLAQMIKN